MKISSISFWVFLAGVSAAGGAAVVPCPRLVGDLSLDGSMADVAWRGQAPIGRFFLADGKTLPAEQTEVRICYDETNLYVLCTCREQDVNVIRKTGAGAAEDLSRDDRVELLITVPGRNPLRVLASAGGALRATRTDGGAEGAGGQPVRDWTGKTGVQVFKHAWGVEIALPLSGLGLAPKAGAALRLNVIRHRMAAGETSRLKPEDQFMDVKLEGPPVWLRPAAAVRPRAGIRYSAADIANARKNMQRYAWARNTAGGIIGRADRLLAKPLEYHLSFMPPKGATFAYGFAGCPACGASWPRFGAGLCSFDKPGKVTCNGCGAVFPNGEEGSPYRDPGTGVEIEGHMYYFKGIWHAWVINQYKRMLFALSHAYALTGEERYAERAALIYDAMATLAPSTVGPRDNMRPHQTKVGIFHYYTQQLTENLRSYLLYYDLLYYAGTMDRVSPSHPDGGGPGGKWTVRKNIEKNIFLDTWDVEMNTRNGRLPSLHNHTSATVRAMLGVGMVCGKPDLIRWGIEAAYKFLGNTADPEGQYYETSGAGYNECGRRCNASFADMLWNYDPANYEEPDRFPNPRDYPYGLKLFRHPRLRLLLDKALYDMDCAGHIPRYGDAGADTQVVTSSPGQWRNYRFQHAFTMYRGAATEKERLHYYRKLQAASANAIEAKLGVDGLFWFVPPAKIPEYDPGRTFDAVESGLWGHRATAILRQGKGSQRMALLMLGGTIFPHGNDDTLHISLYSQGKMLTHDVAYDLYGRPVHMGWACRSIANTTVTVDERGGPPLYRGGPNADVTGFAHLDGLSFVAMSAGPACWRSQPAVRQYARACALIVLPGGGYFVDLFNVGGGQQHDYSFHGQVTRNGEGFDLRGADVKPVENAWTLAGLSGHADATFDAPGRSWGERVQPGNRIRDLGIEGEKVGYFNWWPPPGNGYGFLYDVETGPAQPRIVAEWLADAEHDIRLRLHLFPGSDGTIITAKGPELKGQSVIPYLIARRNGENLDSSFLGVMEGYTAVPSVASVALLPERDGMRGVLVVAADRTTDRIWLDTSGRLALARTDPAGEVSRLSLCQATDIDQGGIRLRLASAAYRGTITRVDYAGHALATDLRTPNAAALLGKRLFVSSPDYLCNSAYRIETCPAEGTFAFGLAGFDLAFADLAQTGKDGKMGTSTPMPLVRTNGNPRASGLFDGKLVTTADGSRHARIDSFLSATQYRLEPGSTLRKGDEFVVRDVKAGDQVTIPATASLVRGEDGNWELVATHDVWVDFGNAGVSYTDASGRWMRAEESEAGACIPLANTKAGRTLLRIGPGGAR